MPFSIACSSITWGSFRKADPQKWAEEAILQAIADAGYKSAPAGMWSGRTAEETVALYGRFGLRPAPGYMSGEFWNPEAQAKILEQAKRQADYARGIGCAQVYVADNFAGVTRGGKKRGQVAAQVSIEDEMTDEQWKQFAGCLNEVGRITLAAGVQACVHNHVGTFIETRREIDKLMGMTDPAVVFLGPDMGHLAWAGGDVGAFCRDYASRIKTVHLKDIHGDVVAQGRKEKWDYNAFSAHGVFAEFGEGCVDFPAVFKHLEQAGMSGPAIVEIDVTRKASPVECITVCRDYLKKIGYWRP